MKHMERASLQSGTATCDVCGCIGAGALAEALGIQHAERETEHRVRIVKTTETTLRLIETADA